MKDPDERTGQIAAMLRTIAFVEPRAGVSDHLKGAHARMTVDLLVQEIVARVVAEVLAQIQPPVRRT